MTHYTGSCHCGAVRYSAEADIQGVMECNCSHCSKKGFLLAFIPASDFTLETPDAPLSEYRFNKMHIAHKFCPTCGVEAFAHAKHPVTGVDTVALNVRCLKDVDISRFPVKQVDGASL
ncbi:MAG: GFA family protein [Alphaproteobacteria bacterium]|nr:GFA family protein [Alphaproteobacteria bacterium]